MRVLLGVLAAALSAAGLAVTLRWWLRSRVTEKYSYPDRNIAIGLVGFGIAGLIVAAQLLGLM